MMLDLIILLNKYRNRFNNYFMKFSHDRMVYVDMIDIDIYMFAIVYIIMIRTLTLQNQSTVSWLITYLDSSKLLDKSEVPI